MDAGRVVWANEWGRDGSLTLEEMAVEVIT